MSTEPTSTELPRHLDYSKFPSEQSTEPASTELPTHLDYSKSPSEELTEEQARDKWIAQTPHKAPTGMAEVLAKAAWRPKPRLKGTVLLTSGEGQQA